MALPKWQSYKVVEGDKIVGISDVGVANREGPDDSGVRWTLACGEVIKVSLNLASRLSPRKMREALGGYFVRYEDGFESWSPAAAWEGGYRRIEG